MQEKIEERFFFWHNCIWIGIVKLSLLRIGNFSSAANVLTTSPKIWHVNKRPVLKLDWLGRYDRYRAWARLPCCLLKGPLKRDFLDIYPTTFSESVISEIQNLWGSFLFSKYLKFDIHFKNAVKNWGNVLFFWDNCIWIGIVQLSLLKTGYFSSSANVLKSSPKIWHV